MGRFLQNILDIGDSQEIVDEDYLIEVVDSTIQQFKDKLESKARERLRLVLAVPDEHLLEREGMWKTLVWLLQEVLQVSVI